MKQFFARRRNNEKQNDQDKVASLQLYTGVEQNGRFCFIRGLRRKKQEVEFERKDP